jgi:transposase
LPRGEQKKFRARMWLFRRRQSELTAEQLAELEDLLRQVPGLQVAYYFRQEVTDIFDTSSNRREAESRLDELRVALDGDSELVKFFELFDRWREGILAYFDRRETSGPVEGLNNKARVITRRSYGLKNTDSLWKRLILDVNRAGRVVRRTVADLHTLARAIQAKFRGYYI